MAGSTHSTIYMPTFQNLQILIPPVNEQIAIAESLNDIDAYIVDIKNLIQKKQYIRMGAMQTLLSGKIRLPGYETKSDYRKFEGRQIPQDWIDGRVGQLFTFEGGSQPDKGFFSSTPKPGYIRLIQIRDYKTDKFETYIPKKLARRFCSTTDIMIGRYGPPIFQILKGLEGSYNVALIKAIPKGNVIPAYAYYFLKQESLFLFIERLSQRTSGQTGVDLRELKEYPMPLPSTLAEQTEIGQILSDMDLEIHNLETKLEKSRMIRKGMMQELFTGRTRLL